MDPRHTDGINKAFTEDAILQQIFGMLPFRQRLKVLPLVCKRWASVLRKPSPAWECVEVHLPGDDHHCHPQPILIEQAVFAWFGRHPNCVRRLDFSNDPTFEADRVLNGTMLATVNTQCSSLETLRIVAPAVGLAGARVAALTFLTRLTSLEVIVDEIYFEDRGRGLLRIIQRLPALTVFSIGFDGMQEDQEDPVGDTNGLPRCMELASMHSSSLTRLMLYMLARPAEENLLRLGRLPQLRVFELSGEPELPRNIRIDAASFSGVPQLQSLRLYFDVALQLQNGCLQQLTALTSLVLQGCGLETVPSVVASVSATLRVLDLSWNDPLQIDDMAVTDILACSRLTTIGLAKADIVEWQPQLGDVWQRIMQHMEQEAYIPLQISVHTYRHLLQLPSAFCAMHGRLLDISPFAVLNNGSDE